MATYFDYEKVHRMMHTAIVSNLLNAAAIVSNLLNATFDLTFLIVPSLAYDEYTNSLILQQS